MRTEVSRALAHFESNGTARHRKGPIRVTRRPAASLRHDGRGALCAQLDTLDGSPVNLLDSIHGHHYAMTATTTATNGKLTAAEAAPPRPHLLSVDAIDVALIEMARVDRTDGRAIERYERRGHLHLPHAMQLLGDRSRREAAMITLRALREWLADSIGDKSPART
jgi:hypothetical protein